MIFVITKRLFQFYFIDKTINIFLFDIILELTKILIMFPVKARKDSTANDFNTALFYSQRSYLTDRVCKSRWTKRSTTGFSRECNLLLSRNISRNVSRKNDFLEGTAFRGPKSPQIWRRENILCGFILISSLTTDIHTISFRPTL